MSFEALAVRRTTRDFCYGVERMPHGHYAAGKYINEEALNNLQLMLSDIYFEYCVLMFH